MPAEPRRGAPLRVALVGIGSAATRAHLPALDAASAADRITVVGVCDPDAARRNAVIAVHSGARGFAENEAMLEATRPDLLVIATPPSVHLGEMEAAAARGVHVLCEKPLGLSEAEVATLQSLASGHRDLALATVHQYGHAIAWQWLARAAAGAVRAGEPFTVDVTVERPGTDPLSAGGWRADPQQEGGILGDHAVHYLALLRLLDPACAVLSCLREGPGGRETATVEVRAGQAGRARVEVSYAGRRRRNVVRLERPQQCLEMTWTDGTLSIVHDGRESREHVVGSLSDRTFVNALYAPMYEQVIAGLTDRSWRADACAQTVGVAKLLATALRMAG